MSTEAAALAREEASPVPAGPVLERGWRWPAFASAARPADTRPDPYAPRGLGRALETGSAGLLAVLWVLPVA